jgi:hypothetical protein
MDAAVRGRISRQPPCLERHSAPGEAFGKWHRSIVVGRGVMICVLLQNLEGSRWCFMPRSSRTDNAGTNFNAVSVNRSRLGF